MILFINKNIMLNNVVPTFEWTESFCVTIQMKAIEQYFHVALFMMLYKVALTF